MQDDSRNPEYAMTPFITACGHTQINHAGFIFESAGDRFSADF
jgi:hypothetical protein